MGWRFAPGAVPFVDMASTMWVVGVVDSSAGGSLLILFLLLETEVGVDRFVHGGLCELIR